jgi:mannose-6-phosphate isomerase-like protein (cupin superfamily)
VENHARAQPTISHQSEEQTMAIRRVVTGHDDTGKAIVMIDGPATNVKVRAAAGGLVSTLAWVTDETPANTSHTSDRAERDIGVAPPEGGSVFRIVDFPPLASGTGAIDHDAVLREMGLGGAHDRNARSPFMHRTRSIDYAIVMEGEIDMLLDDSEVHLKAGDVLVQQGTNHAWMNHGTVPCRIAFVLIDAVVPAQLHGKAGQHG